VHAKGQVVSFRTASALSLRTIIRALNYYLPGDIAVWAAGKANASFNVSRDAVSREYEYRILNSRIRSPLAEGFVNLVAGKLNIRMMNKACQLLIGKHDFASFAAALDVMKSTVRTVYEARFTRKGQLVTFYIVANSFLSHQVRNTVGLLVRMGLGKVGLEEVKKIMEAKKVGLAGPTAPPYGLYLTKVNYPADLELKYENLCN
jgi:tRNA pseudouridine38-40 synthase